MFCDLLMLAVHLQWKLNPGHQVLGPDVLADCATWSPNGSKLRAQKSNLNLTNQKSYFSAYFMVSLIGQSQRTRQNFFTSSKPAYLNSQGSLKLSHMPSNMLWAVSVNIIPQDGNFQSFPIPNQFTWLYHHLWKPFPSSDKTRKEHSVFCDNRSTFRSTGSLDTRTFTAMSLQTRWFERQ